MLMPGSNCLPLYPETDILTKWSICSNYSILEQIGNFIQITASNAIVWSSAGEAAKTAVDGN